MLLGKQTGMLYEVDGAHTHFTNEVSNSVMKNFLVNGSDVESLGLLVMMM